MYLAIFGLFEMLFLLLLVGLLPLFALIDILRSDFEGNNKLIWVIVVLFFPLLGAILYFLIGKNQKKL
ncbi:MAG TPA: PLD nuclease N-terminal domain-containing protein [Prolixibacteraceae bacterium]|nr:PLD nuclease N-terminal domain-containing protein [Prolixibacteraceae bacterium]